MGALAVIVGEDLNGYNVSCGEVWLAPAAQTFPPSLQVHGSIDGYPAVQLKVNPHGLDLKEELQKRGLLCVKQQKVSAPGGTDDVARRELEASVVQEGSTNRAEPGQQVGDVKREASVVQEGSTNGAEPGQQVGDVRREASVVQEGSTNVEPGQQVGVPEATLTNDRESAVIPLQEKTVPSQEDSVISQENGLADGEDINYSDMELD